MGLAKHGLTEFPESHARGLDSLPPQRVSSAFPRLLAVLSLFEERVLETFRRISRIPLDKSRALPTAGRSIRLGKAARSGTRKPGTFRFAQPFFLSIFRFSVMSLRLSKLETV
jgi:hypothetical protein